MDGAVRHTVTDTAHLTGDGHADELVTGIMTDSTGYALLETPAASGDLTASMSSLLLKAPATPITNFPLPRELRDEIYAYLLHAERVEVTAKTCDADQCDADATESNLTHWQDPRTFYKFSTAILAVNKSIGVEAAEYLYEKNCFVRVCCKFRGYGWIKAVSDIPVITDKRAEALDAHSFSIDLTWPGYDKQAPLHVSQFIGDRACWLCHVKEGTFVVSLHQLDKLCDAVKFLTCTTLPPAMLVTTAKGEKVRLIDMQKQAHGFVSGQGRSLKMSIQAGNGRQARQQDLLTILRTLPGVDYDASTSGFQDDRAVSDATLHMSPSLVFPDAFLTSFLGLLEHMKLAADTLAQAGHLVAAFHRFNAIIEWYAARLDSFLKTFGAMSRTATQTLQRTMRKVQLFLMDVYLSFMFSALLLGEWYIDEVPGSLDALATMLEDEGVPSCTGAWSLHCISLYHLRIGELSGVSAPRPALEGMIASLSRMEFDDERIHNDVHAMERALEDIGPRSSPDDHLGSTSASPDSSAEVAESCGTEKEAAAKINNRPHGDQRNGRGMEGRSRQRDNLNEVGVDTTALWDKLSISAMPFPIFDSVSASDQIATQTTRNFDGWTDVDHLQSFNDEDKAAIHEAQKSAGLALTQFN